MLRVVSIFVQLYKLDFNLNQMKKIEIQYQQFNIFIIIQVIFQILINEIQQNFELLISNIYILLSYILNVILFSRINKLIFYYLKKYVLLYLKINITLQKDKKKLKNKVALNFWVLKIKILFTITNTKTYSYQ